ncbi:MAG TPA: hypothetical protein VFU19_07995 [Iamia sp.]|nr:hypothetical protein [Iamia sp.]
MIGTYVLPLSADEMTSDPIPADRVAGRRAWRAQGAVADEGVLVDVGGRLVALAGVTAAEDDLLAAAAAVTVEGDRAVVPAEGLPDGWSALGEGHVFDLAPGTAALQTVDAGPVTWMAAYGSSGVGHVVVSVSEGDAVRVRAARLVTDDVEEVEVRGHDALLARTTVGTDPAVTVSVTWEERPGVIVQVASSADLDADVVLDLARAVVPVTTEALPDLRRQVMETQALDSGGAVVGRGTFGDVDWILVDRRDDGMLELLTTAVPGASSSQGEGAGGEVAGDGGGGGPAPVFDGYTTGNVGAFRYGLGEVAAGVAAVEVRDPDGTLVTEAAVVEGSGVRAWVAELPAGPDDRPYVVVALDATGTELGTTTLHG